MIVIYTKDFDKSISKISDANIKVRLIKAIEKFKEVDSISNIPNIKSIANKENYYRLRIGDYRLFFIYKNGTIEVVLLKFVKRNEQTYKNL